MKLRFETRAPSEGTAVIKLVGELDVYTSPQLKEEIVRLTRQGTGRLVMDLNEVEYLDSTGLGVLLGAARRASERDGSLTLVCDNSRIRRIFELTGLGKVFRICASEAEALKT